jgi:ABC-2 type transport system permease protein
VMLAIAFIRRDWLRFASYRLLVVWQAVGVVAFVGAVYLAAGFIGHAAGLSARNLDYVPFVLAGLAFTDLYLAGLKAFPQALRDAQLCGTLEPMLLAPLRIPQLVAASSLFVFLQSLFRLTIVVTLAVAVFGYWRHANVITAILVLVPGCLTFAAVGLFSAAFVVLVKQGDPVAGIYGFVSSILGGTIAPITVLPGWMQHLSQIVPLTHALNGTRLAMDGASPQQALTSITTLWIMTLVLLPAALLIFGAALTRAKREGSLVQY